MTIAVIAIKGDQIDQQNTIFQPFNYIDLKEDITYDNIDGAIKYLFDKYVSLSERDIALWAQWAIDGWTIFYDPEMVNLLEEDALLALSTTLNTEVFTFIIQSTSSSFGFAKYSTIKERQFMSVDGSITDDLGAPLPEESDLNINEHVFINDILNLADKLGIDIQGKKENTYIVKQLGYNEILKDKLAAYKQTKPQKGQPSIKPWWKFW